MKHCLSLSLTLLLVLQLAAQNLDWSKSMGGAGSDHCRAVTVDAAGNVYVTGNFDGTVDFDPGPGTYNLTSNSAANIFVQKLSPTGGFLWAVAMDGLEISRGYSIAVDASGNVYSTGFFAGPVDFDPGPNQLILNSGSSIWRDFYVLKLDANGGLSWALDIGGANEDIAYGVTIDGNGDIVVVGGFENTVDFDPGAGVATLTSNLMDVFVLKLDPAGNYLWAKAMPTVGPGGGDDYASAVGIDAANNIFITGTFGGEVDFDPGAGVSTLNAQGAGFNAFIEKLDPNGNFVWVRQAASNTYSNGLALEVCGNGDVLASGIFTADIDGDPGAGTATATSQGGFDGYLYRLDGNGNLVWFHSLGGIEDEYARAIAEDAAGNIHLAGEFKDIVDFDPSPATALGQVVGDKDIFIQQLSASGAYLGHLQFGGLDAESAFAIATSGSSQYLAGYFRGTTDLDPYAAVASHVSAGVEDAYVLKLNGVAVSAPSPATASEWKAFPNPSSGIFHLAGLDPSAIQHLQLTNSAGTLLPLVGENERELDLTAYPKGIYHLTIRTARQVATLRLVHL